MEVVTVRNLGTISYTCVYHHCYCLYLGLTVILCVLLLVHDALLWHVLRAVACLAQVRVTLLFINLHLSCSCMLRSTWLLDNWCAWYQGVSLIIDMVQQQAGFSSGNSLQTKPSELCLEVRCEHDLVVREGGEGRSWGGDMCHQCQWRSG